MVYVDGEAELVFGTSCSTPVFSSILSTINQARLNIGKSVVGVCVISFFEFVYR